MKRLIINTTHDLSDFCAECSQQSYISIDTEFVRESTYYPQLCLVQIAMQDKSAVIDPLIDGLDLAPLYALLANPRVIKVFHAARQDLEIFYHLMKQVVFPLFDTQIAAMALGVQEQISYQVLVKQHLQIDLDKASRMTQWHQRPLSQTQLDYAFMDVEPLYQLYPLLLKKLGSRQDWLVDMHSRLVDAQQLVVAPENAWQLLKIRPMKPKQMGAVVAIAAWREATAMKLNIPRRWVLSDESVLAIAQSLPKTAEECYKIRVKPKKIHDLSSLLTAIHNAEPYTRPRASKRPEPNEDLLQVLRLALHRCARQNDVAVSLMCNAESLQDLSGLQPDSVAWQQHPVQQGWRREIFGQMAEKIACGKVVLCYRNQQLDFVPITDSFS